MAPWNLPGNCRASLAGQLYSQHHLNGGEMLPMFGRIGCVT